MATRRELKDAIRERYQGSSDGRERRRMLAEYASHEYQQLLAEHGVLSSMSRKGNCWDNAVAESFFASFKVELVYQSHWRTRTQARSEVFEYIELFYNRQRRHSALGYLCPNEFELRHQWQLARIAYSNEVNQ